jgi:hypothetical protein
MSKNQHNDNEDLKIEGCSREGLKRNSFQTPEGYFDNLTPRVMEAVRGSETVAESSWPIWLKVFTPAAGIAVVAMAVWFFIPPTEVETPDFESVLASLSVEELTLYADVNSTELVKYELVDYSEVDVSEMTEDELLEYLELEDEIEINTLINVIDI